MRLFCLIFLLICFGSSSADPQCTNLGRLFYIGTNGSYSFWLSISRARIKEAQLQGPLGQIVDNFDLHPRELHLSASPFIGLGSAGEHTLYNIKNTGPCFIDSATQRPEGPPELPDLPDPPGGETPGGGFEDSPGGNVLSQLLLNVNKNFLTTYLTRSYGVSERIDNAFLRCEDELESERWQFWMEPRYGGLHSRAATGNPKANSKNLQMGGSYNFNSSFLLGLSILGDESRLSAFAGSLINKNQGVLIGPYWGLKWNNIIFDTWLVYGYNEVKSHLIVLKGNFFTYSGMISSNISSLFELCDNYNLQPKFNVFYSHAKTSRFSYTGVIPNLGIPVRLRVGADKFEYARASLTFKLFKEVMVDQFCVIPSVLAGVNNNFILPDHKRYLNSNVEVVSRNPWSGVAQAGISAKLPQGLRLDFLLGYYSIGVKEDLWDARLALTWAI